MSGAIELLSELSSLGVELSANGDRLHVKAPRGVVSFALREKLASQKSALLGLLAPNQATPESRVKSQRAKVWRVEIDGRMLTMIDPEQLSREALIAGLHGRFGIERVGCVTDAQLLSEKTGV